MQARSLRNSGASINNRNGLGRKRMMLLAAAAVVVPAMSAAANTDQWVGGNASDWNNAANWSPAAIPGAGDTVNVTSNVGVAQNILYDYNGVSVTLGTLNLALTGGSGTASETISLPGNTLLAAMENVGGYLGEPSNGVGTFNQSGGTNTISPTNGTSLVLGYNTGDQGFYNLVQGTLSAMGSNDFIGYGGIGEFNQSGGASRQGTVYIGANGGGTGVYNQTGGTASTSLIYLGYGIGSSGTYVLGGNGALSTSFNSEYVGYGGVGNFNQSGGSNSAGQLNVGFESGSTGTYTQSGGFATLSMLTVGNSSNSAGAYVLSGGTAAVSGNEVLGNSNQTVSTFNQSGGTNSTNDALIVGSSSNATARYTLSGGSLSAVQEIVGDSSQDSSSFIQTGGSNTARTLALGESSGSTTSYVLSGAGSLLTCGAEYIGIDGTSMFSQTGGANTIGTQGGLSIAELFSGSGTYALSGGTLTSNGGVYIGGYQFGTGGSGVLAVSGGTLAANSISIDSRGSLIESAGSITTGTLAIAGQFNDQGGSLSANFTSLSFGGTLTAASYSVGALQSLTQSGGTLSVGQLALSGTYLYQSGTVNIPASMVVDQGGAFSAPSLSLTVSNGPALSTSFGVPFTLGALSINGGAVTLGTLGVSASGVFQATQGGSVTLEQASLISGVVSLDGGTALSGANLEIGSGGLLSLLNATVNPNLQIDQGGELRLGDSVYSNVSSPSITNNGLIDGSGRINGSLINNNEANANTGQSLTLTGSGDVNEALGVISLSGGSIEFTQALQNSGQISGYGTLRVVGGLTNAAGGFVSVGGLGITDLFGTMNNSATFALAGSVGVFGTFNNASNLVITGNAPNYFYGSVMNSGAVSIQTAASSAYFLGPYTGTGPMNNSGTADFEVGSLSGPIDGTGAVIVGTPGAPATLQLAASGGISEQSSLTIDEGSKLDVTNNELIINYGSGKDPISSIVSYLSSGYAGGAWTGPGIISSSVAGLHSTSSLRYAVGYIDGANPPANYMGPVVGSGSIEIEPTLAGDATLAGTVNFHDFQVVLSNFGKPNQSWDEGDFDYSGSVDFYDFQAVLSNFGQTSGALTSSEVATLNDFAAKFGDRIEEGSGGLSLVSVPEPASLGMISLVGFGLLRRKRRNCHSCNLNNFLIGCYRTFSPD